MFNEENGIYSYAQKMIIEIVSQEDKETIRRIEQYCVENNIVPKIIEKEKLDLILKLGIEEYNKKDKWDKLYFIPFNKDCEVIVK